MFKSEIYLASDTQFSNKIFKTFIIMVLHVNESFQFIITHIGPVLPSSAFLGSQTTDNRSFRFVEFIILVIFLTSIILAFIGFIQSKGILNKLDHHSKCVLIYLIE